MLARTLLVPKPASSWLNPARRLLTTAKSGNLWAQRPRPVARQPTRFFLKPCFTSQRNYATYKRFGGSGSLQDWTALLRSRYTAYFAGGAVLFCLYNLDLAPFTERKRVLWIPYWMERKIGDFLYSQVVQQYRPLLLPETHPAYVQVQRVVTRLLETAIKNTPDPLHAAHLKLLDWTVHIIGGDQPPNAFILPNGKIFAFALILPLCKSEDGLATVLAHELAHQLAHHSLEQLGKLPLYVLISAVLYAATGLSWFSDLLVAGFLRMPASREMELEADRIGCELMARLCFNTHEAAQFWRRMEAFERRHGGGPRYDFLATHPNTEKRIRDITLWMPELDRIAELADCNRWFWDY